MEWLVASVGFAAAVVGLYGLHRGSLWLEDRGYVYYLRKKPGSTALGSLVALQRMIEPTAEHIRVVGDGASTQIPSPGGDKNGCGFHGESALTTVPDQRSQTEGR